MSFIGLHKVLIPPVQWVKGRGLRDETIDLAPPECRQFPNKPSGSSRLALGELFLNQGHPLNGTYCSYALSTAQPSDRGSREGLAAHGGGLRGGLQGLQRPAL